MKTTSLKKPVLIIELAYSNLPDHYVIVNKLFLALNEFAEVCEYEVIKKRSKKIKKEVLKKVMMQYNKERNPTSQEFEKRDTTIRSTKCSFEVIVRLKEDK
jgi:hypothetical protein